MQRPTLEQEKQELDAVTVLIKEYEKKDIELRRIINSLLIMKHTIEQSIKMRVGQTELTQVAQVAPPNVDQHKEEIDEVKSSGEGQEEVKKSGKEKAKKS